MSTTIRTDQTSATPVSAPMMKASVLWDVGRLEVRDVPCPSIAANEVLVRISAVGICGTDAHIFAGHANYNTNERGQPIPLSVQPQILGHEITGQIEDVGSAVTDLSRGNSVVVDQGINCVSRGRENLCAYCRTGDSHQCGLYREHGITGLPGGLAEYLAIPAVNAVKINGAVEATEAALVEPLGCILHSSQVVAQTPSRYVINAAEKDQRVRSILICGAGPAGLLFVQYLRVAVRYDGVLIVSDPNAKKRQLAKEFGASEVINPAATEIAEVVREYTGGKGVEYLIEASGAGDVVALIPQLIRKQATVLLYGHGHAGTDMSLLNNLLFKEPKLVATVGASGGFDSDGRPSVYRRALQLIEDKRIEVRSMITHRYAGLEQVETALSKDMQSAEYVKGVVLLDK